MSPTQKPTSSKQSQPVAEFMNALDHPLKPAIQELLEFMRTLDPSIGEEIKWNAPSFYLKDYFATFRLFPIPNFQLILHSGSKKQANPVQKVIPDPTGILKWLAKDRCMINFSSLADVQNNKKHLRTILLAWIEQL